MHSHLTGRPGSWHSDPVPSAPADPYAALSPPARLVAQALGVVAPHALGAARLRKLLSHAGVSLSGSRLTDPQVRKTIAELFDAGIAVRDPQGVRLLRNWILPLTRLADRTGNLVPLLSAFLATDQRSFYAYHLQDEMLVRCHVVRGDYAALDELVDSEERISPNWWFLVDPLAIDLLERLPPRYLEDALATCLDYVIETTAPPEAAIEACLALSGTPSSHAADIAFIRILQGRFTAAEAVFAELPPTSREDRAATTGLAATRALIALLRNDDAGARAHIDAAIAAQKAGTRRRIVFPDSRAFALSLLALVRMDTPECADLLQRLLKAVDRLQIARQAEIHLVLNALQSRHEDGFYGRGRGGPGLELLFDGLAFGWRGHPRFRDQEWRQALLEYCERAAAHGFAWVAAECEELLRRSSGAGAGDDSSRAAEAHARLGTVSLATLAMPIPAWERSLRTLEQYAYDTVNKAAGAGSAKATGARRLVWKIDTEFDDLKLSPREQRQNKNGTWTKGRKVALKRLAQEAASMDHLRDEDRAAAAAIDVVRGWYGGEEYALEAAGAYALAGHPHVFNARGETVEIVRREPALTIDEDDGKLLAAIEPRGPGANREYTWTMVSDRRYEVTRFTPAHRRLLEIVPHGGLRLPATARRRLLEAVSALASEVRVQSDVGADAGAAPVEADAEPWVRLEPYDAGLTAALVVEPIPESGICFEPATGAATVFASRDGASVHARRDLDAERQAVDRLLERCGQLASRPTERQPLLLPGPADCLELLDQLEAAGARCKWPRGEPFRIVARASTASLALTIKSAADWLQASGELAVDERRVLDLKSLFALLEAHPGSRFLELERGEFLALSAAFRRQLDDFASLAAPTKRGEMRLHPFAALALDELVEGAELTADRDWHESRARLEAAESFEPELPSTLQAELRPYQLDGFRWLARLSRWGAGACLADDMGLGKTVQTLALLVDRAPAGPALVVAPTSVIANWIDEAHRFAPTLNVKAYVGAAAARTRLLADPAPFDLYVTTYGLLQNDAGQLAEVAWHSAVLDEAQAIKNSATKRARAARRLTADFRLVTTGTPIQNNLMDLHSLFAFTNPGLLGSVERFRRNFGLPVERDGDEVARARLRRLIAPFILRRLKSEVLDDLPERTEVALHVEMSSEEAALYEVLRQRAVEELEGARTEGTEQPDGKHRVRILAHLTRLRLACCNPRLVVDDATLAPASSKLETFAATLDELLANRHKVLVFSQFVRHLRLIEEYLHGAGVAYQYLDGATPAKSRAQRIAAFQAGQGDVFLISLKAGGVGLNLTAADYVIHMDPWWNPAVEDQASDRAHRIGQTRPVTIYRLVTRGTIEEQIVDLHHRKRNLADRLLQGSDAAARLDANELLALLRQPLPGMG